MVVVVAAFPAARRGGIAGRSGSCLLSDHLVARQRFPLGMGIKLSRKTIGIEGITYSWPVICYGRKRWQLFPCTPMRCFVRPPTPWLTCVRSDPGYFLCTQSGYLRCSLTSRPIEKKVRDSWKTQQICARPETLAKFVIDGVTLYSVRLLSFARLHSDSARMQCSSRRNVPF